jgi:signal recognition particle subunit SRP68
MQASAGNAENIRDDLNGLDKAVSAVLGLRTIERNQLLVSIAKSKYTKHRDGKNERITRPEELVRLYDLLIQVCCFLSCPFLDAHHIFTGLMCKS